MNCDNLPADARLQAVPHARARLAGLLGRPFGPLLQLLGGGSASESVGLDGLLAVGRELGLPVALAVLLLLERVGLVLAVVRVGFCFVALASEAY
jgi:hypothetical protein